MKDRVENFISDNRKDFDHFEPPADLWEKIEVRLNEEQINRPQQFVCKRGRMVSLTFVMKAAASIVIVLCAGLWFYGYQYKMSSDLSNIDPQLAKQQIHYTSLIEIKRSELKRIEKEEPRLYQEFSAEIRKIDESYQRLKSDLPRSPNQEETVKAMIRNLQIQTQLLNQQLEIIQQINKVKKEHKDETQHI